MPRNLTRLPLILMKTIVIGIGVSMLVLAFLIYATPEDNEYDSSGAIYDIHGIDVSHHQGTIHWDKVKNATLHGKRITFVFAKCTEGATHQDKHYNRNREGIKQAGMIVGAYHFFLPGCHPEKQARNFIQHAQVTTGDLPPVLDIEHIGHLSDRQLTNDLLVWLELVEEHFHCVPIIYSGNTFYHQHLNDKRLKRFPFWKAHYQKSGAIPHDTWLFCQYTKQGHVSGIGDGKKTSVDLNVFQGSMEELEDLLIP